MKPGWIHLERQTHLLLNGLHAGSSLFEALDNQLFLTGDGESLPPKVAQLDSTETSSDDAENRRGI